MKYLLFIFCLILTINFRQTISVKKHDKEVLTSSDFLSKKDGRIVIGDELRWLSQMDELNGWADRNKFYRPYLINRIDYIEEFLYETKVSILGEVDLLSGIESTLVALDSSKRQVFLMNHVGDSIISAVEIFQSSECYMHILDGSGMEYKYYCDYLCDQDMLFEDSLGNIVSVKSKNYIHTIKILNDGKVQCIDKF